MKLSTNFFQDRKLHFAVLTYIENFSLAGTEWFVEIILDGASRHMEVCKVEREKFRNIGLDVRALEDSIKISMKEYINRIKPG